MEENQHVQLPTPQALACPKASASANGPSFEGIGLFREVPLPPPRKITPQRTTPLDNSALGQQLLDMQTQFADILELQKAMHLNVGEIHTSITAFLARKSHGSRLDTACPGDGVVQENSDSQHEWVSQRESVSQTDSYCANSPTGNRGDHPWRHRARSHAVLPFQKKRMEAAGSIDRNGPSLIRAGSSDSYSTYTARPSVNSFGNKDTTQREDMTMLFEIFRTSEQRSGSRAPVRTISWLGFGGTEKQTMGVLVNSLSGALIALNAIFIGIRLDHDDNDFWWTAIDVGFTALFIFEIGFRAWMSGLCQHFCGLSRCSNIFDATLVFIDIVQQISVSVFPQESGSLRFGPSASLFRIARLGKLARMLHLLRLSIFKDLLTMLQGMWGGLATLGWSMVLCAVAMYIVALFFRELFGTGDVPNVTEYFSSVPRSMFTTFRCSFGDCTSNTGVPVFEYVSDEYGTSAALFYCFYVFVITIGLFNVISAVFVESTMNAASSMHTRKKKERLRDHDLWCTNVGILVKRLVVISKGDGSKSVQSKVKLTDSIREVYFMKVPCAAIDELAQDPEAINAFAALDIASEDRDFLSDILDPNNTGTIHIIELIEGLRRLRGDPRRSDIVTINLMLRSIQRDLAEVFDVIREKKGGEAK